MTVFFDTSAVHALIVPEEETHERAREVFDDLLDGDTLVTHNYVSVEAISLMHSRYGRTAARAAIALLGVAEFVWVDRDVHAAAADALLGRGRSGPSFVDHVSFAVMEERSISRAFAYDGDFARRGFELVG